MKKALLLLIVSMMASGSVFAQTYHQDIIGVTHVDGKYHFNSLYQRDFLNEGAYRIRNELGSRVIKLWLTAGAANSYPFNSPDWPAPSSVTDILQIADHPYFRQLFSMPFTTFILTVEIPNGSWFNDGMSAQEEANEENGFYRLTRHLMLTYAGTNKTFVLQNWEGDWLLRMDPVTGAFLPDGQDPSPTAVEGMKKWWNARQRGVNRARAELAGVTGVRVQHAAEVNLIVRAKTEPSRVSATNNVLPYVNADLYSYSAWDSGGDANRLKEMLTYLDIMTAGTGNIYVGEYGAGETEVGPTEHYNRVVRLTEAALEWGALYVIYWEFYCNSFLAGPPAGYPGVLPTNSQLYGFWLVRPDNTRSPVWDYFRSKWNYPRRRACCTF